MKSDFPWVLMAGQIGLYIFEYIPTLKSAPKDHQRSEGYISFFFPVVPIILRSGCVFISCERVIVLRKTIIFALRK